MTQVFRVVQEFNPTSSLFTSHENLAGFNDDDASGELATRWSKKTALGGFFRTMGKMNHTYESTDGLSSMHGSTNSLASSGSSPGLFDTFEQLTIQQRHSSGNLYALDNIQRPETPESVFAHFFDSLAKFLRNFPDAEHPEPEEEDGGAETHFPKLC